MAGGYVLSLALSERRWAGGQFIRFAVSRYCRLGCPYLAAVLLALAACTFSREALPESLIGPPAQWAQLVAHVFFLQDILGYESLSAGFWFVCINFQLSLLFAASLCLGGVADSQRENAASKTAADGSLMMNGLLAVASLFVFNMDRDWDVWPLYFYAQFFLGIIAHRAARGGWSVAIFWAYIALTGIALYQHWRAPLALSTATAVLLFFESRLNFTTTSFLSRLIEHLGRTSYSLFLIHFPILVLTAAIGSALDWTSPALAMTALVIAYAASLAAASLFYQWIERPANELARIIHVRSAASPHRLVANSVTLAPIVSATVQVAVDVLARHPCRRSTFDDSR